MYIAHKNIGELIATVTPLGSSIPAALTSAMLARGPRGDRHSLPWSLPDSQFIGISCLHQNLPETFIHFGTFLWDPWVGDSRSAHPLLGHARPDSTKIVWFRQTLCYSARKIYIQFNCDYSLMLEAKETNGAKMATLLQGTLCQKAWLCQICKHIFFKLWFFSLLWIN